MNESIETAIATTFHVPGVDVDVAVVRDGDDLIVVACAGAVTDEAARA